MRIRLMQWTALAVVLSLPLPAAAASRAERDVAQVVDRFAAAWNRHDMQAFADLYAADADFVNVIGLWWHGRDQIRSEHVRLHEGRMRGTTLRTEAPVIRFVAPTVAVAHVRWELRGDAGAPGWKVGEVRRGVLSHVLVKQGQRWRIVSSQNTDVVDLPNN